jgi:hypothetical protein
MVSFCRRPISSAIEGLAKLNEEISCT